MSATRKALWHTGIYATGLVVNRGVAYLLVPVYTRVWSEDPAAFSVWDVSTTTVLMLSPIVEVAMGTALQRFYYQFTTRGDRRQVFNTVFQFLLGSCGLTLVVALGFAPALAELLFDSTDLHPLVRIVGMITAAAVLANLPLSMLRAEQRSLDYSLLNLLRAIVAPPISLYLLIGRDMGPEGVLWGEFAGHLVIFAVGMFLYRRWIGFGAHWSLVKAMLYFSIPIVIARFGLITINYSDRYILKHLIGLEAMAPASLGFKAAIIITLFTRAVQTGWPASAFELANQEDGPETMARLVRILAVLFAGAAIGLAAFSPELIMALGPSGYSAAQWYVPWIALSYSLFGGVLLLTTMISVSQKTILLTVLHLTGACIKVSLAFLMIGWFGGIGAPLSTVATYLVSLMFAYYLAQRVYPIPYETAKLFALLVATLTWSVVMVSANLLPYQISLAARVLALLVFPALLLAINIVTRAEMRSALDVVLRQRDSGASS